MSPLITALFIVLCVGLVGAVAAFVRDRMRYAGYRDVMREAIAVSKTIDGEIFRDGGDLVISGEQNKAPLIVRFSHAESTPGLSIHMGAPAAFAMSTSPRGQHDGRGVLVRTPDDSFNMKFEVRSDEPTEAKMFVEGKGVTTALSQLCRSSHDFLTVSKGAIEFGQLGYPNTTTARSIPTYIESLSTLRRALEAMPGAETVKVEERQHQSDWILRATVVAGIIAAALTLYVTSHEQRMRDQRKEAPAAQTPEGMSASDAALLGDATQWRSSTPSDAEPNAVAWLRERNIPFSSHIALDANGTGERNDNAYLLTNNKGEKRIVLIIDGNKAYDARYQRGSAIARVPKEALSNIKWGATPPTGATGDALLLVRDPDDVASGLVIYYNNAGHVLTASPANYQTLPISSD
jgi:hypothetical protein